MSCTGLIRNSLRSNGARSKNRLAICTPELKNNGSSLNNGKLPRDGKRRRHGMISDPSSPVQSEPDPSLGVPFHPCPLELRVSTDRRHPSRRSPVSSLQYGARSVDSSYTPTPRQGCQGAEELSGHIFWRERTMTIEGTSLSVTSMPAVSLKVASGADA